MTGCEREMKTNLPAAYLILCEKEIALADFQAWCFDGPFARIVVVGRLIMVEESKDREVRSWHEM
jgi:predicted membrane chloride channel (bestrophin family)